MRFPRRTLTTLAVLATVTHGSAVPATSPASQLAWTKSVGNGKYVFVMHAGDYIHGTADWAAAKYAEAQRLRQRYPSRGLYRNDGSTTPLWTFRGYAYESELAFASDGVHMVRVSSMTWSGGATAVEFYASGEQLADYRMADLIDRPGKDFANTDLYRLERYSFDEARMEYTVVTADGNRFVFDVRTGKIIEESRPGRASRRQAWALGLGGTIVACGVGVLVWRYFRRRAPISA